MKVRIYGVWTEVYESVSTRGASSSSTGPGKTSMTDKQNVELGQEGRTRRTYCGVRGDRRPKWPVAKGKKRQAKEGSNSEQ